MHTTVTVKMKYVYRVTMPRFEKLMTALKYIMFSDLLCPGNGTCSNQGTCDGTTGTCICNSGFQGDICQGKIFLSLSNLQMKYRATLQTRTLRGSQSIPTGKYLFSLEVTPVLITGSLFSLQGFPCKPLYFPVRDCSVS